MSTILSKYTLDQLKRELTKGLKEGGIDTPALDARLLIMSVMGMSHADMIAQAMCRLTREDVYAVTLLYSRRLSGEPIDHILGYRDFYGRRFEISKDVLSSRPETEGLIDAALKHYGAETQISCLDLGTGSGAIMLTLLAERPHWNGVATDISDAALKLARYNAAQLDLMDRVSFTASAWFENIEGKFDLIVSNPPYIDLVHMKKLSKAVKDYDPALALYGGEDGLDAYKDIIREAGSFLKPGGRLILEIGYDQASAVKQLMHRFGFQAVECHKDLSGHDRIIEASAGIN